MSSHNLKYLQHLTAEQAALTAVGITDCNSLDEAATIYVREATEQAKQILNALLSDIPLAKQILAEKDYGLTPLRVCAEDEGNGAKGLEELRQIEDSKVRLIRKSLAEWFAAAGNYVEACRVDPKSAQKSTAFPSDILNRASRKPAKLDANSETNHNQHQITYCMQVANEIFREFYAPLQPDDELPKKEYLVQLILERHPTLSENQAKSIYTVTRPEQH